MHGKEVDGNFTLSVSIFQTSHERGVSGSAGIGFLAKKFNNLFIKNFPRDDFQDEDLKVSKEFKRTRFLENVRAFWRDHQLQSFFDTKPTGPIQERVQF